MVKSEKSPPDNNFAFQLIYAGGLPIECLAIRLVCFWHCIVVP